MTRDPSSPPWTESDLGRILCTAGVWDDESPEIEAAGDGNINWVRRLRSRHSGRTVIVKHARPTLEEVSRVHDEHRAHRLREPILRDRSTAGRRRRVPDDPPLRYGPTAPRAGRPRRRRAPRHRAAAGCRRRRRPSHARLLSRRGPRATWERSELTDHFRNQDIQALHGAHIFELPYAGDGFPVPEGVAARAAAVRADDGLAAHAKRAQTRYAEPHGALVHGDVQPGNVLLREGRPVLLDAEIAHVGDPAFDVGTLLAHVWLARLVTAPRRPRRGRRRRSGRPTFGPSARPARFRSRA